MLHYTIIRRSRCLTRTTDRPRERLAELGPQALSNAEMIAILLRAGGAE